MCVCETPEEPEDPTAKLLKVDFCFVLQQVFDDSVRGLVFDLGHTWYAGNQGLDVTATNTFGCVANADSSTSWFQSLDRHTSPMPDAELSPGRFDPSILYRDIWLLAWELLHG